MDDSSGVGAVPASRGVASGNSGGGSRCEASDVDGLGDVDVSIASSRVVDQGRSNSSVGTGVVSIAEAVVVAQTGVPKSRVSESRVSVAKTMVSGVSSVSQTVVSTVQHIGVSLGISLSLPLGDVDNSGRVGNVASGSSVASSDGGGGSGGEASDVDGGRVGDAGIAGSNNGGSHGVVGVAQAVASVASVSQTTVAGVSKTTVAGVSQTVVTVASVGVVGIGLGLRGVVGGRSQAEDSKELVHDEVEVFS